MSRAVMCGHRRMRNVIFSMGVSLDGYIAGPGGEFDWSAPDDELHRFHNDQTRELSAHLCGRRLYETMVYWERPDAGRGATEREFAGVWQSLPKIVFSSTLAAVEGNARLATGDPAEELARLEGDIAVGGAGLAATLIERGLVDEFRVFVNPVIVGGGTPFFPALGHRIDLELIETRTFGSRVTYARYRRAD
jgi:dihydrofolate reductase